MSPRIAMGKLADGNYGLRIAKAGFDPNANPPVPANLIFDSQWPALLPIHQSGVGTVGPGNTANYSFPSLGYIPMFSYMIRPNSGVWSINRQYPSQFYQDKDGSSPLSAIQVWIVDGQINIQTFTSGHDQLWPISFDFAYMIYKIAA